jgi:hypothetical protein
MLLAAAPAVAVMVIAAAGKGDVTYAGLVLQQGYIPAEHHKLNTKFLF